MSSSQVARKLVEILFAEIIDYPAMMEADEVEARSSLNKFRNTLDEKVDQYAGQLIRYNEYACLYTFEKAVAAMECAKNVQQIFQAEPSIPVRIGVHSGEVFFEADNLSGDSINIASQMGSLGIAGAVLFSKKVQKRIADQTELEPQSLGGFYFKNAAEPMEVFVLANAGLSVPRLAEMKRKLTAKKKPSFAPVIGLALLVAAIVIGLGLWKMNTSSAASQLSLPNPSIESIVNNSLALLPFSNQEENEEIQYFCDGLHEDLLTQLSKIESMKVISRSSVLRYKNTEQTIPEIAQELKVANILEGSVRRVDNQIRINVRLIKAASGEQIWSEIYERELNVNNIFDIQREIISQIVAKLKANINKAN